MAVGGEFEVTTAGQTEPVLVVKSHVYSTNTYSSVLIGVGASEFTGGYTAPLVVDAAYYSAGGQNFWYQDNATSGWASSSQPISIAATNSIISERLMIYSDERVKNIKGISNSQDDLTTLNKLQITDYKMIDSLHSGNHPYKKVVAQQVKEIFPQAVDDNLTKVIPSVYSIQNFTNGICKLPNEFKAGDQLQIKMRDNKDLNIEIVEANENSFKIDSTLTGEYFVYGHWVHDFHQVDYDALSMLNISATQELYKRIVQLEKENEALLKQNTTFNKTEKELKASIATTNKELEELKSLVKSLIINQEYVGAKE